METYKVSVATHFSPLPVIAILSLTLVIYWFTISSLHVSSLELNIFVMTINPTKLQSTNAVGTSQQFQELRLLSSNLFHASRLCLPNLQETKGYLSIIDRFWSRVRRKFLFECTRDKGKLSKSKIKDSWLKSQAKYQSWAKRIVRGTLASLCRVSQQGPLPSLATIWWWSR